MGITLPETNIAPETVGLEDEFPFGRPPARSYVSFLGITTSYSMDPSINQYNLECQGWPLPLPMDPLSNEKRAPSCLGYIGDEILHSYMGIIVNHYKSSLLNNQYDGTWFPWSLIITQYNGDYITQYRYRDYNKPLIRFGIKQPV